MEDDVLALARPVDEEEIFQAIKSLPLGKAPGIDGCLFFQILLVHHQRKRSLYFANPCPPVGSER